MKIIIEFNCLDEDDKHDLELMLSARDFERFLNDVHNKFRSITKYDALKFDGDEKSEEAARKVIDEYHNILNEYNLEKFS